MKMKFLLALPLTFIEVALAATMSDKAPLLVPREPHKVALGDYIVKMKTSTTSNDLTDIVESLAIKPRHVYSRVFPGFAASLSQHELDAIRRNPNVELVEHDSHLMKHYSELGNRTWVKQGNANWALARISNSRPNGTSYNYHPSAGEGTCVYILDHIVDVKHPDFEGRATVIGSIFGDGDFTVTAPHGTQVAGIVGSKTYGVAKKTRLLSVGLWRDGATRPGQNDPVSNGIAGLEFAARDMETRRHECPRGFAATVSFGADYVSETLNHAATSLVQKGVFVGQAAGNADVPASTLSPPSANGVCVVSGVDRDDTWRSARFAYGPRVDLLAPGVDVPSTFPHNRYCTESGTSFAGPFAAGLAAYLMGLPGNSELKAQDVCQLLKQKALRGEIKGSLPDGTPNLLLHNDYEWTRCEGAATNHSSAAVMAELVSAQNLPEPSACPGLYWNETTKTT